MESGTAGSASKSRKAAPTAFPGFIGAKAMVETLTNGKRSIDPREYEQRTAEENR